MNILKYLTPEFGYISEEVLLIKTNLKIKDERKIVAGLKTWGLKRREKAGSET